MYIIVQCWTLVLALVISNLYAGMLTSRKGHECATRSCLGWTSVSDKLCDVSSTLLWLTISMPRLELVINVGNIYLVGTYRTNHFMIIISDWNHQGWRMIVVWKRAICRVLAEVQRPPHPRDTALRSHTLQPLNA